MKLICFFQIILTIVQILIKIWKNQFKIGTITIKPKHNIIKNYKRVVKQCPFMLLNFIQIIYYLLQKLKTIVIGTMNAQQKFLFKKVYPHIKKLRYFAKCRPQAIEQYTAEVHKLVSKFAPQLSLGDSLILALVNGRMKNFNQLTGQSLPQQTPIDGKLTNRLLYPDNIQMLSNLQSLAGCYLKDKDFSQPHKIYQVPNMDISQRSKQISDMILQGGGYLIYASKLKDGNIQDGYTQQVIQEKHFRQNLAFLQNEWIKKNVRLTYNSVPLISKIAQIQDEKHKQFLVIVQVKPQQLTTQKPKSREDLEKLCRIIDKDDFASFEGISKGSSIVFLEISKKYTPQMRKQMENIFRKAKIKDSKFFEAMPDKFREANFGKSDCQYLLVKFTGDPFGFKDRCQKYHRTNQRNLKQLCFQIHIIKNQIYIQNSMHDDQYWQIMSLWSSLFNDGDNRGKKIVINRQQKSLMFVDEAQHDKFLLFYLLQISGKRPSHQFLK